MGSPAKRGHTGVAFLSNTETWWFMHAPAFVRLAGALAAGALLAACGGGGGSVSPPVTAPQAPAGMAPQALSEGASTRSAQTVVIPPPPQCTPIINVNPATQLNRTRTARYTDIPDRDGNDSSRDRDRDRDREHGDGLQNIDGTGCDYTIYLGPQSKHARLHDARVHGGAHIQVVADGAQDLQVRETAVDGGQAPVVCNVFTTSCKDGVWFAYGASGSIERSFVTNASTGVVIYNGAHALVGETLITNTSFLGVNILTNSNGTVEDTLIDNATNTGSGVAVQLASIGVIRRTTAVGKGVPSSGGAPQFGFFFGHNHPTVTTDHATAIHNQTGFGSYCAIGINSVADLTNAHDSAVNSTVVNYDVNNNPTGINCI